MSEVRPPLPHWHLALLLLPLWSIAFWRLVSVPEEVLVSNVLVDDALYFALPAKHAVEGHGFSFDGIEPTNGVQTLWALCAVALAGVFADPTTMLRAMVGLSGLCWLGAAVGLYLLLRRRSEPAALFAAVGFAWCGVHRRMAFEGMENGLQALLCIAVLLAGARAVRAAWSVRATLSFGLSLAAFALGRTEGVLLALVVGAALMCGWLGVAGGFGARFRKASWLALPGVVLVGGACLASRVWFGSFLPISGSVKQFYEAQWGGVDDVAFEADGRRGLVATFAWHFDHVLRLAIAPLREHVPALLADVSGLGHRVFRNLVWAALGCGLVTGLLLLWRRRGVGGVAPADAAPADAAVAWCFGVYAVLHLSVMGIALPHFTAYGIWYFAAEMLAAWLGLGVLLGVIARRWPRVACSCGPLAALVALASVVHGVDVEDDVRTSAFRRAGVWLREHTEPDTVIGTLSSGLVGWYAEGRHVVNLDGLINNRRYLDDYLRPARLADYFADRGITWFADYQPLEAWRNGISWFGQVPAERLVPRRYWRLSGDTAYVVWQVLEDGAGFELLGPGGPVVRDRYAELAVSAEVHGRFPVVADAELQDALAQRPGAVVARSTVAGIDEVWHVLATPDELARIALRPESVHPEHAERIEPAPGLVVLGYDQREFRRGRQRVLAITVFAMREAEHVVVTPWWIAGSDAGVAVVGLGRRAGFRKVSEWPVGEVITETLLFELGGQEPARFGVGVGPIRRIDSRDIGRASYATWFTR